MVSVVRFEGCSDTRWRVPICWSEDLALGVAEIDEQHEELFARVDRLLEACQQRRGKAEVARLLDFLDQYVEVHFAAEEALLDSSGYPEAAFHRILHRRFTEELQRIRQSIEEEPGVSFALRVNRLVVSWLRFHVAGADRRFAEFLRARRGESGEAPVAGRRPGRKGE